MQRAPTSLTFYRNLFPSDLQYILDFENMKAEPEKADQESQGGDPKEKPVKDEITKRLLVLYSVMSEYMNSVYPGA